MSALRHTRILPALCRHTPARCAALYLYPTCGTGGAAMRTSAADRTLFQVRLKGGRVWTGTEQELRTQHPSWIPHAQAVQPPATRDTSDDSDLLTQIDQDDLYDDPHPGRLPNSSVRYNAVPGQRVRYEFRPETTIPRRATAQR